MGEDSSCQVSAFYQGVCYVGPRPNGVLTSDPSMQAEVEFFSKDESVQKQETTEVK